MKNKQIHETLDKKYSLGFSQDLNSDTIEAGLNEEVVKIISQKKQEPQWLLQWRLEAFAHWKTLNTPSWARVQYPPIDYQAVSYYSAPKKIDPNKEIDADLMAYYEKLGVPLKERDILSGRVAVDAVMDSVSVGTTFKDTLEKQGIIFCSFSEAVKKYPQLVQQYLGTVVNYKDNFYAALNSAVFSDGSFCFIPKGVKCPMDLSTYFRINQANTGQFERTLIIAEEGSSVSYLEGCFLAQTPIWTPTGNINIEDITLNSIVYDHQGNHQKVKALMSREYEKEVFFIEYSNNLTPVKTTHEHPFFAINQETMLQAISQNNTENLEGQWTKANELNIGDYIYIPSLEDNNYKKQTNDIIADNKSIVKTSLGVWLGIIGIKIKTMKTMVYNFEVSNTNTYLAHGIAVHNCSAPARDENQLHAAVVELIALDNASIKYSTVQNWFPGDENGKGGVYNFVTKRGECRGNNSHISWTQIETGSAITWKYPSVVLRGDNSVGEFYSIALTNHYQQADTGTKMIHLGKNTKSTIIAKSISAGNSIGTYRGLVRVASRAEKARNFTQCDSLIFGNAQVYTEPYIESFNSKSILEHEATTSKMSDEHLFYLQQRGLTQEQAKNLLVNGFCKSVFQKLPAEFAVEAQKLLEVNLEGSMG